LAGHFKYGKTVAGRGIFFKPNLGVDPETGKMDPDSTEAHACVVADVEVDTDTGDVKVLSLRSVYEIGRQVNPALVAGQIKGGSVMGMAHALYESTEPYYPNPDHRAGGFFEYILPLAPDVPEMEMRVLEYPSENGPYGVKGFGEMTANAPIPAIVNAINNALGTDISCHPVTPEVVLRALEAKK
jgi:CO/xanthine dehydrogenase Mo-binding subunit